MDKPRLLWICNRPPLGPFGGDTLLTYEYVTRLSAGWHITVLSVSHDKHVSPDRVAALPFTVLHRRIRVSNLLVPAASAIASKLPFQLSIFRSGFVIRSIQETVQRLRPDIIVFQTARLAQHGTKNDYRHRSVAFMVDSLSYHYTSSAPFVRTGPLRLLYRREAKRLLEFEKEVVETIPSIFVSARDVRWMAEHGVDVSRAEVIPNGVPDLPGQTLYGQTADSVPNRIAFFGNLASVANHESALVFAREVVPKVRKAVPGTQFAIVGGGARKTLRKVAMRSGVELTGYVEDRISELSRYSVLVSPVFVGAGMQNKVLDGIAAGSAQVISSKVSEGIPFLQHQRNCLVGDSISEIADWTIELLKNAAKRKSLAANAQVDMRSTPTWDESSRKLCSLLTRTKDDQLNSRG